MNPYEELDLINVYSRILRKLCFAYLKITVPLCLVVFWVSCKLPAQYGFTMTVRIGMVNKVPLEDKALLGLVLQDPELLNPTLEELQLPPINTARTASRYVELLNSYDPSLLPIAFYAPTPEKALVLSRVTQEKIDRRHKKLFLQAVSLQRDELQKYRKMLTDLKRENSNRLVSTGIMVTPANFRPDVNKPLEISLEEKVLDARNALLSGNTFPTTVISQDVRPTRLQPKAVFNTLFAATLLALCFLLYGLTQAAIQS